MRISIEAHFLNHPIRSGLLTYTEGVVEGLSRTDRDNRYSLVFYSVFKKAGEMPGPLGSNFTKCVLPVPDRSFRGKQPLIDHLALPAFLKFNKVDVFHRAGGYTLPAVRGVKKILTIHDLRSLTINDNFFSQDLSGYRAAVREADVCVTVSECTKRDIVKYLELSEEKIRVIPLAAESRFQPASEQEVGRIRQKFGLSEPFFLSVGSVPRKNIEGILKAFAAARRRGGFTLAACCNRDLEKYRALAEALGIAGKVKFIKYVSDADLVALFSACHCFLFPSLYEGFGLPILEAMQCGTPVITANDSSCPEVAGEAAVLVDPNKIEEISEAIDQMCQNESLRRNLIGKGFERARHFDWNASAREIRKVYEGDRR